jgi:hypothetical protein
MQKTIFLCAFLILSINSIYSQQKVAEYIDLTPNIFSNFGTPTGIAILPFTYQGSQIDLDSKFYNELTSALGKKSSFIINFYKNLDEIKSTWKIKNWDPNNVRLLKKLKNELDIQLIVYAVADDPEGNSFELKIVNTSSGKEEFSGKYYSSSNSKIIDDAVMLFTENKAVVYKDLIDTGTLVIRTIPEGKFPVYINDEYSGETPYTKYGLEKGSYKITVKDNEDVYESFETNYNFEPVSGNAVEEIITLKPNVGSLILTISPAGTNIDLYNSKNNHVNIDNSTEQIDNPATGNIIKKINNLPIGEYKLKVNKPGYLEANSNILIQKNIITKKEITLLTKTSKYYFINNVICESDVARNVTLNRNGNKYTVSFDIAGEADDNYEIELYLVDKDKNIERKLTQLTGIYGEGKFYGTGNSVEWDFEKEINGGIDNGNLNLELRAKKLGGGIAWYVWVGGVVAGGVVAAVLVGGNKGGGNNTGTTTIPTPPVRPSK